VCVCVCVRECKDTFVVEQVNVSDNDDLSQTIRRLTSKNM